MIFSSYLQFIEIIICVIYNRVFFLRKHPCIRWCISAEESLNPLHVHTTTEKFKNAALFLRFGLPSTIIRHENGGIFENAGFAV